MYEISKIEKLTPIPATLPDGTYSGLISGYNITIRYKNETYYLKSKSMGFRGFNIPCSVYVENGNATFNTTK